METVKATINSAAQAVANATASTTSGSKLFTPLKVGDINLKHRIVMAPLTRFRADDNHVPLPIVKEYYEQRASVPGTLLITEATFIAPEAGGYPNVPGIWNDDQAKAWKEVTDAVHAEGSFIYLQLWALGRAAKEDLLKEQGYDFVSASDRAMSDNSPHPRPLTEEEIHKFIGFYVQAAKNAVEKAGFDGVEIHGANGYLIDQFWQDVSNIRTDKWGGSIENRARFGLEISKAVVNAIGADKTGIRLSPWSSFQGMRMENPIPQFTYVIEQLKALNLAYLHVVESRISGAAEKENSGLLDFAFDAWGTKNAIFVAGGFSPDSAKKESAERPDNTAVAFGRYFISNPDLPFRIKNGIALNEYNRDTFYKPKSPEGYIDYPFSKEWESESAKL